MQMQRYVTAYYKRKLYKGRSGFARAADFVFLRLFFFAAVYLVCIYSFRMIWLSVLLAALLTAALSFGLQIYKGFNLNKFMNRELSRLKKECLLENIVMMGALEYRILIKVMLKNLNCTGITAIKGGYLAAREGKTVFAKAFFIHPSEKVNANEVLTAYKTAKEKTATQFILLTPSEFNKEAQIFAKRQENIILIQSDEFLDLAVKSGFEINDEEANQKAYDAIRKNAVTPDDIREAALSKGKAKAYMLCGIFALVWSYVSGFRLYYPIIAIACFVLAFYIHRREQNQAQKQ